jgi:hypothetical protein
MPSIPYLPLAAPPHRAALLDALLRATDTQAIGAEAAWPWYGTTAV